MSKKDTPAPLPLRAVRLELAPEMHRRLRRLAAEAEMPMSRYVRELVEKKIQESSR